MGGGAVGCGSVCSDHVDDDDNRQIVEADCRQPQIDSSEDRADPTKNGFLKLVVWH